MKVTLVYQYHFLHHANRIELHEVLKQFKVMFNTIFYKAIECLITVKILHSGSSVIFTAFLDC